MDARPRLRALARVQATSPGLEIPTYTAPKVIVLSFTQGYHPSRYKVHMICMLTVHLLNICEPHCNYKGLFLNILQI
ncbi:hypothetical protein Naga_100009g95 [Nannochloropsis gaditana]|uniref:Uncharacterized protein n=1 Tax=Nannochloropsis gaditana TaxID=72520 RepID=W7TNB6_9STRA|nr:hypothetical protein Naga_100009g95 [Nannochloropsis gaditana]